MREGKSSSFVRTIGAISVKWKLSADRARAYRTKSVKKMKLRAGARTRFCRWTQLLLATGFVGSPICALADADFDCSTNQQCPSAASCEVQTLGTIDLRRCTIRSNVGVTVFLNYKPNRCGKLYPGFTCLDPVDSIEVKGIITADSVAYVRELFTRFKPRSNLEKTNMWGFLVAIDSPGGDVYAAMALGRLFRENHVSISLNGVCASACVLTWVGAVQRVATQDKPLFVIHRPYGFAYAGQGLTDSSVRWKAMQADIFRYLVEMNIPPTLLDAMNEVPSEDGRALTADELSRYLITSDDPAFTEVHDAGKAQKLGISRMEYLGRKRRVAECLERGVSSWATCFMLYDKPT